MDKYIIYIHGQNGSPEEAEHYRSLFPDCWVVGLEYTAQTPWEAKAEFPALVDAACGRDTPVTLIANSIGAYFAMSALAERPVAAAYFISPIVDMQKLIETMMTWAGVTEDELHRRGRVETAFGQTLDWDYLTYTRRNPIRWSVPTHILYGGQDNLTPPEVIRAFAERYGAALTVMEQGEHWFHTESQMKFLDDWLSGVNAIL